MQVSSVLVRPLSLITQFLNALDQSLQTIKSGARLTHCQKAGLALIMSGIIATGMLNWAAFGRRSLGKAKPSQLRWMFYNAKIAWELLLQASIKHVLATHGITFGTLVIDDSGKKRTKKTTRIPGAHKVKDKATGGYYNGQEVVFLVLVTDTVTIPVCFRFYQPDPAMTAWRKRNKDLKAQGVPVHRRPRKPIPDHDRFPTLQALALEMISDFTGAFPAVKIKGVLADALYGTGDFMDKASTLTSGAQVISQLRSTQIVSSRNSTTNLKTYFSLQRGVHTRLIIRGGKEKAVTMLTARLYVKAHGKRRFVVALKYEGEADYRYPVASDLSWRHTDIARLYSLRWLVEVFIQDWKKCGGWNRLSKQQGVEGSERGLIVSLLCNHLLLLHPEQIALLKNKQPGMPAGCLIERLKMESLTETVKDVAMADDPEKALKSFTASLQSVVPVRSSSKHMAGRDLGSQEPSPFLIYRARAA